MTPGQVLPRRAGAWLVALVALISALPSAAQGAAVGVQVQVGLSQIFDKGQSPELGLELQLPPERFGLYPVIGLAVAEHHGRQLYLCMARDFRLGPRWGVTALTGVAAYEPGPRGIELGGVAQFHSALALSVRLHERLRLSLVLSHLSNAGLRKKNPGTESLSFGLRRDR